MGSENPSICSHPVGQNHYSGLTSLGKTRGATTFSKLGVHFLGLGYCTEQNADGIPSFMHCSNGNHTLHQKSWGGPSKFLGVRTTLTPQWLRPWVKLLFSCIYWTVFNGSSVRLVRLEVVILSGFSLYIKQLTITTTLQQLTNIFHTESSPNWTNHQGTVPTLQHLFDGTNVQGTER